MANALDYEEILVGDTPVGPDPLKVKGGVICAVFYVDPQASGPVNWLPTFGKRDVATGVAERDAADEVIRTLPTRTFGFPLAPDRAITVAGEGTIRNTRFVRKVGKGTTARKVHALYFDSVDVVAADFVGATSLAALEKILLRMDARDIEALAESRKQTAALTAGVEDDT